MKLPFLICSACYLISACGEKKATESTVIRSETSLIDMELKQAEPKKSFPANSTINVGFDTHDRETRMLLFFPNINSLWEEDVVVSSVARIEVILRAADIVVSPEMISLCSVSTKWTPFATWESPFRISSESKWDKEGGDFSEESCATPSLEKNLDDEKVFDLKFDITQIIKAQITKEEAGYGFLLKATKSDLNYKNEQPIYTYNSSNEKLRPVANLSFITQDVVQ